METTATITLNATAKEIISHLANNEFGWGQLATALRAESEKSRPRKSVVKALEAAKADRAESDRKEAKTSAKAIAGPLAKALATDETPETTETTEPKQRKLSDSEMDTEAKLRELVEWTDMNGLAEVEDFERITGKSAKRHMAPYSWNLGEDGRQPSDRKPLVKAALRIGVWGIVASPTGGKTNCIYFETLTPEGAEANRWTIAANRAEYDSKKEARQEARSERAALADKVKGEVDKMVNGSVVSVIDTHDVSVSMVEEVETIDDKTHAQCGPGIRGQPSGPRPQSPHQRLGCFRPTRGW